MKDEYLKKIDTVPLDDLDAIIQTLKDYLDDESLLKEQRLFAVGCLLNKNKEQYIHTLKQKITNQKNAIKKIEKELEQLKQPKKKVYIVKKKTV